MVIIGRLLWYNKYAVRQNDIILYVAKRRDMYISLFFVFARHGSALSSQHKMTWHSKSFVPFYQTHPLQFVTFYKKCCMFLTVGVSFIIVFYVK